MWVQLVSHRLTWVQVCYGLLSCGKTTHGSTKYKLDGIISLLYLCSLNMETPTPSHLLHASLWGGHMQIPVHLLKDTNKISKCCFLWFIPCVCLSTTVDVVCLNLWKC